MTHTITLHENERRWGKKLRIVFALAAKDIADGFKNKVTLTLIVTMLLVVLMFRFLPYFTRGSEMNVVVYSPAPSSPVLDAILDSDQLELWEGYESETQMFRRLAEAEETEIGLVLPADLDTQLARGDRPEITAYVPYFTTAEDAESARQLVEEEIAFWTGSEVTLNLQRTRVFMDMDSHGASVPLIMTMIYALTVVGVAFIPHLMVAEKKEKTIEALLVSPATPGLITIGKGIAGLFYALVSAGIVLAIYAPFILNWPLAILAALLGAMLMVTLGLILGTRFENRQQLQIVAWVLIAPFMLGYFLSLESSLFPEIVGRILDWIPTVTLGRLLMVAMVPEFPWLPWTMDLFYLAGLALACSGIVIWLLRRMDR